MRQRLATKRFTTTANLRKFGMIDSLNELLNLFGLGAGAGGGGYAFWQSKANRMAISKQDVKIEKIDDSVDTLALLVARDYVTKSELNSKLDKMQVSLDRIIDKLESKADK